MVVVVRVDAVRSDEMGRGGRKGKGAQEVHAGQQGPGQHRGRSRSTTAMPMPPSKEADLSLVRCAVRNPSRTWHGTSHKRPSGAESHVRHSP